MEDFIETFLASTSEIPSPKIFRLWAAISVISSCLERRVWSPSRATKPTMPNMFITLAGMAGCGKTEAINLARDLLVHAGVWLAEDNITPAAFYDSFEESVKSDPTNPNLFTTSMCVCNRELGVLLPKYDMGFLSELSDLFDNQDLYTVRRRTSKSANGNLKVTLQEPSLNMLSAVTPAYLTDLLPETAWGQGFCSRMIFIYGYRKEPANVDVLKPRTKVNLELLYKRAKSFRTLHGEVEWSDEAHKELNLWFNSGMPPSPQHIRLREYRERRLVHYVKLCMISAVSAGRDTFIIIDDLNRAKEWILEAEQAMPDIFRAMVHKSDSVLFDDLQYFLLSQYFTADRKKRDPIPESVIYGFLKTKVESHRIKSIVESAIALNIIKPGAESKTWIPLSYDQRTDE
jgi:hypothetical protein